MVNPLTIVSTSLTALMYIYKACEAVKENREECKRFCDHANSVLKALESRCTGDTVSGSIEGLVKLHSAIGEVKTSVKALSKRSFVRRIIMHEDLSLRIRRAYNDMHNAVIVFNLGATFDMAAFNQASETARRIDRRNLDKRCKHVLDSSKGDHELLALLQIRQEEMQQALVSIRKRLPAVHSRSERRVLENGLQALERHSARKHNLPDEFIITTLEILVHRNLKLGHGGFARVYEADWRGTRVAVKEFDGGIPISVIEQEIDIWRRLHHPHIVQFYGACSISDPPFMVCALKANGNANDYLNQFPKADRCKLLHEASLGLVYLHQQGVVHGDLKGNNILVDEFGKACLSDFGLAKIKTYSTDIRTSAHIGDGTLRWMAPEQLRTGVITKLTDIYSLGMTIYEVFSGHPPFIGCPDSAVIDNVSRGFRPPTLLDSHAAVRRGLTADIWSFIEECWRQEPEQRPPAIYAGERLLFFSSDTNKRLHRPRSSNDVRQSRRQPRLTHHASNPHLPAAQQVLRREGPITPRAAMPVIPLPHTAVPVIPLPSLFQSPVPRKTVRWDLAPSSTPQHPPTFKKATKHRVIPHGSPTVRNKVLTKAHQTPASALDQCVLM